jgi:enoyl-CoA hydratase/carnithine racemase
VQLETLLYREEDGVAFVTLNRPEVHNCYNAVMERELARAWCEIRENDGIRAVVLSAAGDQAFSTGVDRREIPVNKQYDPYTYDDPGNRLGPKSQGCWKPVIAAINGMAGGGAFYILGECDVLIAAEHATFFDPHVTYGMPAVFEPITMMARMPFGEAVRMSLMGTAERISAQRAYEIGLITEVAAADELLDAATRVASMIASFPTAAVQATLRTLWAAREFTPEQGKALGNVFLQLGVTSKALREGQAVFESRKRIEPRIR